MSPQDRWFTLTTQYSSPDSGAIRGSARMALSGEPLPGVTVSVKSEGVGRTVVTDIAGHYEVSGLASGTYELAAQLAGFRSETRSDVQVAVGDTVSVDFSMKLGILNEVHWVIPAGGLRTAYRSAEAVVHLRILRSLQARLWKADGPGEGGFVGTEHEAIVLEALKIDPDRGPSGSEVRFVQYPAGVWSDGTEAASGLEAPYSVGEECVAFLEWDSGIGRFTRFVGPIFMIPVRDGRIVWERSDLPGVRDGMTMDSFFAVLRALSTEAEKSRLGSGVLKVTE